MTKARVISRLMDANKTAIKGTFINIGPSVTVYNSTDDLPTTGNSTGDKAYVTGTDLLYNWSGSGWYKIALINTFSPHWVTAPDSDYTLLKVADSEIRITVYATDSDGVPLTYTAVPDSDFNTIASITKDSDNGRTFIIKTDSDAVVNETGGSGEVVFKASDGVNIAVTEATFTVTFSNVVSNSAETLFLLKATGDGGNNSAITYLNSSNSSTGFTELGTPQASTFSPYRSGGYSVYFDGSGDRLEIDSPIGDLSSTNYTIEGWYYFLTDPNSSTYLLWTLNDDGGNGYAQLQTLSSTTTLRLQQRGGSYLSDGTFDFETYTWYHIATVWDGTNMKVYVNGAEALSSTTNVVQNAGNGLCVNGDGGGSLQFQGYIRDFRIVTSAVYTSAGFTPPTRPLTAITGTDVLICHLPYLGDGSTNSYTITPNGTPQTQPFGPYDYEPWAADDHGGSVYFDGTGDGVYTATSTDYDMSGDVTVECWVRPTAAATNNHLMWTVSNSNSDGHSAGYIRGASNPDNMGMTTLGVSQTNATGDMSRNDIWYHCAWVKEDSPGSGDEETRFYFNGKRILNQNGTSLWSAPTTPKLTIGKSYQNTESAMLGYIADFHWTNSAKYTGTTYTVPTAPVSADANTILRMSNKSDAKIYDATSSFMAKPLGNCQADTGDRKFSTSSSIDFDGSGDEIQMNHAIELFDRIGTGDFTLEAWVKSDNATKASQYFVDITGSGCRLSIFRESVGGGSGPDYSWNVYDNGYEGNANSSTNAEIVQWHHIAFVKRSSVIYVYINGTEEYNFANTMNYAGANEFNIGGAAPSRSFDNYFQGWMQDIRLSIGARYTGNFTPPTAEFEL